MRVRPTLVVAAITAAGLALAVPAGSTGIPIGLDTLTGTAAPFAVASAKVADLAANAPVTFQVVMPLRNQAGAEALAMSVSDPKSASYGQFLTPAQFHSRFAATDATVSSVQRWLTGAGFTLTSTSYHAVAASGTAAQVESAFHVNLASYRTGKTTARGADRDLSVPSALRPLIKTIAGVSQLRMTPDVVAPGPGFRNARPCSAYYGQTLDTTDPAFNGAQRTYAPCGYVPSALRTAYGENTAISRGYDGRGTTVAIVDAFGSPTIFADASTYAQRNDPTHPLTSSLFSQSVATPTAGEESSCDAGGWYGEETLDVEAVHATAPGAKIYYVGAADCADGLGTAVQQIVDAKSANIVSNSYGSSGELSVILGDEHDTFVQAAAEGIGMYFSSGDEGDDSQNMSAPGPDYPASDPFVTGVGGTSLGLDAKSKKVFETGWETGKSPLMSGVYVPPAIGQFNGGSGGGTSTQFAQPTYQAGVVPVTLSRGGLFRVVPDISALADPNTGFLMGQTQTFPDGVYYDQYRIGGTSLASPLTAGLMAVNESAKGKHFGFANPLIYSTAFQSALLVDVVHEDDAVMRVDYTNSTDASGGLTISARTFDYPLLTIHTAAGYDDTTGVGTFKTVYAKPSS